MLSNNTIATTLLTNSPAQTCIALGANYNYGKQGLPDLPTRLRPRKLRQNNTKRSTACPAPLPAPATTTTGPDSSKRKTTTTPTTHTSTALNLSNKKDLFPSSYRPYDDKTLIASSKGLDHHIPATLSRSSNESTTSSNSNSSTVIINGRRGGRRSSSSSKKVTVFNKNTKRQSTSEDHRQQLPKELKTISIMRKSSTSPAEKEYYETLPQHKSKNKGLVNHTPIIKDENNNLIAFNDEVDHDFQSTFLTSASFLRDSSVCSAKDEDELDDDSENASLKEEDGNNDNNCMVSRPATEKVRCTALPLLKQRLGYLWEKKMFTDVIFLVGRNRQKIEAHRVILASCSEVFQNLFYREGKPLQSSDEKYILYENDFSESALEVFIKAMYTNEIPICLTLAMALEVFYATKKYAVIFLEDQVLEHIRQLLTVSNVFEALRFSTNAVELTYLAPICWRIVEERTAEVLEYYLDNLEAHLFVRILERERLSVDEVQLFQFAVRWAANLCKLNGMKVTGKNKRHFMEPLLKHFRFTTMSPAQFTEVVAHSRILDSREIQQIQSAFHKVADLRNIALPYKTIPRVNTANQLLRDRPPSPTMKDLSRLGTQTNLYNTNSNKDFTNNSKGYNNMDGSGDGQQVQMICSDSVVVAPGINKKATSSTKLKNRRVPSAHSNKAR